MGGTCVFLAQSSLLPPPPPAHQLPGPKLSWDHFTFFWSCQGACNSEHGFLKMFKNLARAVKMLPKIATE